MRTFLECNTEWTIYPLAHYPNGPSPAKLESKLSALIGQLKQQFTLRLPTGGKNLLVTKGSICLDGISQ